MSIVTMRANLTDSDIRSLIKGPGEDERAHAAHKICRCIEEADLSPEERAHAEGVLAIMAQDAAILVRRALAVALKNSPNNLTLAAAMSSTCRNSRSGDPVPQFATDSAPARRASSKRRIMAGSTWEPVGEKLSPGP